MPVTLHSYHHTHCLSNKLESELASEGFLVAIEFLQLLCAVMAMRGVSVVLAMVLLAACMIMVHTSEAAKSQY